MDEIYQASLPRRVLAALLDLLVTLLLSIGLFMLLVNGAVDIGFHNLDLKISQFRLEEESSLFHVVKDANGNFTEVATLRYDEAKENEHIRFSKALHDYYFTFAAKENKNESNFNSTYMLFDKTALSNAVFSIPSLDTPYTDYGLKEEITDVSTGKKVKKGSAEYASALAHFFTDSNKGVYHLALTEFTSDSRFQEISSRLATIERLEVMICLSLSSLVFLSLPLLLNKHGETAFMHLLGICFVDSYGYQVKWRHKIIRSIVTILLYASSAYLYGIPLLVNALVMLLSPSRRSLLDYASNETCIDRKSSVILEDSK